jgi:hypothetical protein
MLLLHHQHLLDGRGVTRERADGLGGEGVPQHDVAVHPTRRNELVVGAEVEAVNGKYVARR